MAAVRSSRPPFGGWRRHALFQLSGSGILLREPVEQVQVGSSLRTSGMGLPQLPPGYGKTLDPQNFRDLQLREAGRTAQLRTHARRRQDLVQQSVNPLQAVPI